MRKFIQCGVAALVLSCGLLDRDKCVAADLGGHSQFKPEWQSCESDDECLVGREVCNGITAYNKKFLNEVEKWVWKEETAIRCRWSKENEEDYRATCKAGKCLALMK